MLLNFRNVEPADGGGEWRGGFENWKYNASNSSRSGLRLRFRNVFKPDRNPEGARPAQSLAKRSVDIVLASAMLVALLPVLGALAIVIRLDGGPVFFRHRRIGADGRSFYCLKFRSMCMDAETRLKEYLAQNSDARVEWEKDFKLRNDPRITRLGALLRRTSLDELPQLLNVLKGEMSLVGPRPIVTAEIPRYGDAFTAYLKCRPGITGPWQVSGRNDIDYRARVELDTHYASNWSLKTDIAILFRTLRAVFRRSGAY
jgi:undecaprenyl-phosphate galactose phosphotransferase